MMGTARPGRRRVRLEKEGLSRARVLPFRVALGLLVLVLGSALVAVNRVTPRRAYAYEGWRVVTHPDGGLFVGDVLSWEVLPPPGWAPPPDTPNPQVTLRLQAPNTPQWTAVLRPWGLEGRWTAVFPWVWSTAGLTPGAYSLTVHYQGQVVLRSAVVLAPASQRPWWEEGVTWRQSEWEPFQVHFLSRTAAARDAALVRHALEAGLRDLLAQGGFPQPQDALELVFMPRLLGQGGFASSQLWLSYLERDATATYFPLVARHEMVHWLDRQREAGYRSLMLQEGLAVYLTGGHYKPEPLAPRAAALLLLEQYIPLTRLADGYFYDYQHEIAYLEAAALVEYMVHRWGWDAFAAFYWGLDPDLAQGAGPIFNANLQQHFGITLEQLDADFRTYLASQPQAAAWVEDVRLTIALYEALRRYQQVLDPSAYYGTAWLPNLAMMQAHGVVADAYRSPHTLTHVTVELLLQDAQIALAAGAFPQAQQGLEAVTALLDAAAQGVPEPWQAHPWAAQVAAWARQARACGVEPTDVQRKARGEVWLWGWPEGEHPRLVPLRVAAASDSPQPTLAETCTPPMPRGVLWPAPPYPVLLPGPRHLPHWFGP